MVTLCTPSHTGIQSVKTHRATTAALRQNTYALKAKKQIGANYNPI